MANAEKVVDYISAFLSGLVPPGPVGAAAKPGIKLVTDNLKAWLAGQETQRALLEAARLAENDFRERSRAQFCNDLLSQAVISFPLYNGDLFQAALQSLPSHLDEAILATHLGDDLTKYWSREFSPEDVRAATALYLDCLRLRLLNIPGFREVVTGLAILRTDRRTEDIQNTVNEINGKLSLLLENGSSSIVFRTLHQLPQPPADFTGREELITQLSNDFKTHKGAPITGLTGMGGIGKTALGLVMAHQIADGYPDAQIFLDLKGTTAPLPAVEIVRHVLLSLEPGMDIRALNEQNMSSTYLSALHGKRVLLFLDNARSAEQIAPLQPPESCALLVTSRWDFRVPGLHPQRLDVMDQEEAEKFLLDLCPRIGEQAVDLAKACACLPLALRIAGSFLEVNTHWPVKQYLERLNDHTKRLPALEEARAQVDLSSQDHPYLRAAFALSYNQLTAEQQKRWRTLGVFPASFAAPAAQAIWVLDEDEALKLLGLLRRYSLLEYDECVTRYSLHDLLADYACSQMEKDEEYSARLEHAAHYKDVLIAADNLYLKGGEKVLLGLHLFDLEWKNIHAGQEWVAARQRIDPVISYLCLAYSNAGEHVLSLRQHPMERIQWLEAALSAAREISDIRGERIALVNLGNAYRNIGNARKAIEFNEQALVLACRINDRPGEGSALGGLGNAYAVLGDFRKAIEYFEQRLAITRETNDRRGEARTLGNLGNAYAELGDASKAIEFDKQLLVIAREIKDRRGEGSALSSLGNAYYKLGEKVKAIEYYEKALAIAKEIGDHYSEGNVLGNLGLAYADLGDTYKAIEYYEQALAIARDIGDRPREESALGNLGFAYADLGNAYKAIEYYEQALAIDREIGDRRSEGIVLVSLGNAYRNLGNYHRAVDYYEQTLVIDREIGDRWGEEATLDKLGKVHFKLGDVREAVEFYEQCLVITRELGDYRAEGNTLGNLGNAYCVLKDLRKAIECYEQQLVVTRVAEDRQGEANALFNMGLALYDLEEKDRAVDLSKQALIIFDSIESPNAGVVCKQLRDWGALPEEKSGLDA